MCTPTKILDGQFLLFVCRMITCVTLDSLRISKSDLPLPEPFNESWKLISKVIDRLHLRNQVDTKCKELYNPDQKVPPTFNTMACEQTFIWASRFKKVMCAMPHVHQFFFLHRSVKYRNRYTEKCHRMKKTPILPKADRRLLHVHKARFPLEAFVRANDSKSNVIC